MTWTGQTFTIGQILTAAQMNNLQADISALANGDAGAPSISQAAIGAAAVGQGEINTSIGAVNGTGNFTLAGGTYGFYPQVYRDTSGYNIVAQIASAFTGGTYTTNIAISSNAGHAQQRYINASPPINLGHGDIPLFVFLEIFS